MKTRALRITVGCYENDRWWCSIIRDVYDRGVLHDSELLVGPIYCSRSRLLAVANRQLELAMRWEEQRAAGTAAGGPERTPAAAPA